MKNLYYSAKDKIIFWIPEDYQEFDNSVKLISVLQNYTSIAKELFKCELCDIETFVTEGISGKFKNKRVFYANMDCGDIEVIGCDNMSMIDFIKY